MPDARRDEDPRLRRLADEQAALRRVATLVARGVNPDELFSAVSKEVGWLFGADAVIARFEDGGSAMVVVGLTPDIPVVTIGTRWELEDFLASAAVYRTGRPARNDHKGHRDASGPVADSLRQMDFVSTVAAPIVVDGRVWGVMTVSDKRRPLAPDTEERVEKFTELVATAIANADSRSALGRLAEEQAALRRVATLVAGAPASGELFSTVAREVASVLDVPGVIVTRYDADGMALTLGEAFCPDLAGAERFLGVGTRMPPDPGSLAAQVFDTHGPARVDDFSTLPGTVGDLARAARLGSGCAGPIVVNGAVWGKMCVFSLAGTMLPAGTENRLHDFIELLAAAIANFEARADLAASEARARELADEQAALRRVATMVAQEVSPEDVFRNVAEEIGLLLGAEFAAIFSYDPDRRAKVVGRWGDLGDAFEAGQRFSIDGNNVTAQIYRTGRSARLDDYERASGSISIEARKVGMRSVVASPIMVKGHLWGALGAGTTRVEPLPTNAESRIAKFSELVATAISNVNARAEVARLANEQAALRRVATRVAEAAGAEEVFSAVAEEIEEVLDIPVVTICRCEADGFLVIRSNGMPGFPAGSRWPWDVPSLPRLIYQTGRPARIDDFTDAAGLNAAARDAGINSAVGVPIVVGGTVWGSICAATTRSEPLPPDAEERLGRFRELVVTSIANTIMREELRASRARIIAAGDDARRRIERDLHDGLQQRLITLAVALRRAEAKVPDGLDALRADVTRVTEGLRTAVDELRELSRGIHPSILTANGLSPALKALARRSTVRVQLDVGLEQRLPDHVEVAAYYTVSEALTNVSKHANATQGRVSVRVEDDLLRLSIGDDGVGGADPSRGSGLIGLRDRIEALGGELRIESPPGGGTSIDVQIPILEPRVVRQDRSSERPSPTMAPGSSYRVRGKVGNRRGSST